MIAISALEKIRKAFKLSNMTGKERVFVLCTDTQLIYGVATRKIL